MRRLESSLWRRSRTEPLSSPDPCLVRYSPLPYPFLTLAAASWPRPANKRLPNDDLLPRIRILTLEAHAYATRNRCLIFHVRIPCARPNCGFDSLHRDPRSLGQPPLVHASRATPSTYILVLSDRKKREKDRSRSGIRLLYLSRVNRKRDSLFPPGRLAVLLARQKNGGFVMELDPEKRSGPRKYNRAKHPNLERTSIGGPVSPIGDYPSNAKQRSEGETMASQPASRGERAVYLSLDSH